MYKDMMDTIGMVNAADPELGAAMERELTRQRENIELIASENIVSPAVMAAMGSVLTNKYAEGLPGKRYYGGCVYVDEVENIAIQRACQLFGAKYANVQPHSGAQANLAVYFALLELGYQAPDYLTMQLQHNSYGTLSLKLSVLDFFVDQTEATAHIKVEGFDIFNNEFAALVVNTIGDKLILGILDLAFDKVTIENRDVVTTYEDGVIGLDFTKTLQESKIGRTRFLEKAVLDVVHFTDLSVIAEGIKLKATVKL